MKRIIIAAQSKALAGVDRQYTTATISDMLFTHSVLPLTVHFASSNCSLAKGQQLAEQYILALKPDGIILQGGEDICMSFYDSSHEALTATMRDYFELAMVKSALKYGIPLFGICRGMQLINIAMGGTLIPDLETELYRPHIILRDPSQGMVVENSEAHAHIVDLSPDGYLAKWYATHTICVNSFHHQAVRKLANDLQLEALAEDGVVEAFSNYTKKIIGVQWHPEVPTEGNVDTTLLSKWLEWC